MLLTEILSIFFFLLLRKNGSSIEPPVGSGLELNKLDKNRFILSKHDKVQAADWHIKVNIIY